MARDDVDVRVEVHTGNDVIVLDVRRLEGTYSYDFTVAGTSVTVLVIEILMDGVAIPTSPIRVEVEPLECIVLYPGGHRVPDRYGECGELTLHLD